MRSFARAVAGALIALGSLHGQASAVTYQYNNARTGANTNEVVLTPENVNTTTFGKLFTQPVDGVVYGQPLYLPNVTIPGRGAHNVVYVVTEHDSVYAFDADSGNAPNNVPLWHVNFLGPGVTTVPWQDTSCSQITPELGITSTPVIDPMSGTIYIVAMTKETVGSAVSYVQRLHALDVTTGSEKPGSPVVIQATYPGTGEGGSTLVFNPKNYKQRPGLLLLNGTIYAGFSSHCDIGAYHGWLMAYNAATLTQTAVYNNTPNGNEGSFWSGGAAPAADSNGFIYLVSGNGTFDYADNGADLGESYIKLSSAGGLSVADYFTPFNYASLDDDDTDTGSAGVVLLGDEAGSVAHPHLMAGAGKEGRIYLLDRDHPGGWHAGADTEIVQSLPGAIGGLFGNPAYFNRTVYFCGAGDALKAFPVNNAQLTPAGASPNSFSGPGCVPSLSANGSSNGVAWAIDSSGALMAYDAASVSTLLYSSNQNSQRDALGSGVKFSAPMIVNGKVYAGTQNQLVVYGLLPQGRPLVVANTASAVANSLSPGAIVSLYGNGLGSAATYAAQFPLLTQLGGASVTIQGIAAPLLYAGPTQINFQIPFSVVPGMATIAVTANSAGIGSVIVPVYAAAPGIFLQAQGYAAAINQDGSINSPTQPAPVGTVVAVFMTGLGSVTPAIPSGAAAPFNALSNAAGVTATVGGVPANILFAGLAPGYAGLYQVNVQIPPLATGQYNIEISAQGSVSNAAPVSVQ